MEIKYMGKSGRIVNEEELRQIYKESHPNDTDIQFDIWLYLGIECKAIKVIKD
jgi:hypothetical protein